MFFLRPARPTDLETLFKLAKTVYFTNLPADREAISERIRWSQECFRGGKPAVGLGRADATWSATKHHRGQRRVGGAAGRSPHYMFVLEDSTTGAALGTSAVIAEMGQPGNPNVSLQLRRREMFSADLQSGMTHVTVQAVFEENGPTEIGGLILGPSFRGARLGRQLSLVRFHYMGLHPERFKDRVLAEMMGPVTPEGASPFWECFGRRFINLPYHEADLFCEKSREFMLSLLPREEIYLTLLPAEARACVGKVPEETAPARRILESVGFRYHDRIDPFDAGPHLTADTADISMVRDTKRVQCAGQLGREKARRMGFVSREDPKDSDTPFVAVYTEYALTPDGGALLPAEALSLLHASEGTTLGLTPLDIPAPAAGPARGGARETAAASGGARSTGKPGSKKRGASA